MNLNLNLHIFRSLGSVVQRPTSANPGLNFNAGFFFFCSKADHFSVLFRVSNQLTCLNSNLELIL